MTESLTTKIPSFSSKRGHVNEKHVPIACKHEMLGNQTYEVLQPLSKLSRQSLKLFEFVDVFDKQIRPKLQTRYSSVQGFQKWGDSGGGYASNKWNMRKVSYKPSYRINRSTVHKYTKQYHETGNIEPLPRNHNRTRSKHSFGDSMLLETIVQSKGSTLSLSILSRHVHKNLPNGKDYSRKRLGKCAGERLFTHSCT